MAEFTPGPWKCFPPSDSDNATWWIGNEDNDRIFYIAEAWGKGMKTDEANARLIAAAPALYEALKKDEQVLDAAATWFGQNHHIAPKWLQTALIALIKTRNALALVEESDDLFDFETKFKDGMG